MTTPRHGPQQLLSTSRLRLDTSSDATVSAGVVSHSQELVHRVNPDRWRGCLCKVPLPFSQPIACGKDRSGIAGDRQSDVASDEGEEV